MKKYVPLIIIFVTLLEILNSCKKSSTQTQKNVALLTNQSWAILSIQERVNHGSWIDIYTGFQICTTDNKLLFKIDNSYNWDEGPTKCNPSDPQTYAYGTWSLSSDGSKLFTNNGTTTTDVDIALLDNSNLITVKNLISGTDTINIETKYVH